MKQISYFLKSLLCLLVVANQSLAQCPASLTLTVQSTTVASCPDNGAVTLGGNGVGNPLVTFSIIAGPSRVGSTQASHIFNSLSAGTYTFRATCNAQTIDVSATVIGTYTPMDPTFSVNVSGVCNSYATGGTITVGSITGGRAPIQYSFIQNSAANYDDALSNYSGTNSLTTSSWGTYQVRVKDACGVFLTKTINLQPTYPAAKFSGGSIELDGAPCDSARLSFWMADDNGQGVDLADYPSLRFNIYEQTSNCVAGALIKSFTLTGADGQSFIFPKRDIVVEVVTPCGESRRECYDLPDIDSILTYWQPLLKGCGTGPDPYTMNIVHLYNSFATATLTVRLYNNTTNSLIQTVNNASNWNCCTFSNLPVDNYRIEILDACGKTGEAFINAPSGLPSIALLDAGTSVDKECSYQNGKTSVKLSLTGAISNLDIATITISSGPDNIGKSATLDALGKFAFYEMTPGATYGFVLNTGCSVLPLSFTVPTEDWRIVEFTMAPTVTQQCGGSGTINANILYTGWGYYKSELWLGSTKISENNSGVYTNVPPGLYTIKAVATQSWCDNKKLHELTDTLRIYNDATPPQVLRKFGFVCDNPSTTGGRASVEVGGFGPFKYELRRTTPSPEATYTTYATNAPSIYTFTGLDAYAVYSLLITDNCGKSTVTELVVGDVGNLPFSNSYAPCVNNPYLISANLIPNATYRWVRKGSPVVLSTNTDLYFANYLSAYDGVYECTITLASGCTQRVVEANLNSSACGFLLPVKLGAIAAKSQDCKVQLEWNTVEAGAGIFEIQRSIDGKKFTSLDKINFNNNTASTFTFIDKNAEAGQYYYRLKVTDEEGSYGYSRIVSVKNDCGVNGTEFSLYPNPVTGNRVFLYKNNESNQKVDIDIMNASGQVVKRIQLSLNKGVNQYAIDMDGLSSGAYFMRITSNAVLLQNMKFVKK